MKVMQGIRVLEVGQFVFVPAAGAVLADWGADVIKIEHPIRGDAQRAMIAVRKELSKGGRNIPLQHPNRGKRSVGIDIGNPEGLALIYRLASRSDVFLTNFLPAARRKLKIDVEDIRKHNPRIIYARGSALGDKGPEREMGGFDVSIFWARAGSASLVTPPELDEPLSQPGWGYGDTISAMNLAGGISAALFHRERTGEPLEVDVSLLSSGAWATAASITATLELGEISFRKDLPRLGGGASNPFYGLFKTSDGGFIILSVLVPGPLIRDTFEHLGLAGLADDPRFATADALAQNAPAAGVLVAEAIANKPMQYWLKRLSTMEGQWAPYQSPIQIGEDGQMLANGYFFEVEAPNGGKPIKLVSNPVQFNHEPVRSTRAPEASEHTEMVLSELGLDRDEMHNLRLSGAIA